MRAFVERAHFVGPDAARVHHDARAHVDGVSVGDDLHAGAPVPRLFNMATAGAWFTTTAP